MPGSLDRPTLPHVSLRMPHSRRGQEALNYMQNPRARGAYFRNSNLLLDRWTSNQSIVDSALGRLASRRRPARRCPSPGSIEPTQWTAEIPRRRLRRLVRRGRHLSPRRQAAGRHATQSGPARDGPDHGHAAQGQAGQELDRPRRRLDRRRISRSATTSSRSGAAAWKSRTTLHRPTGSTATLDAVDTWGFGPLRGLLPEQPSSLAGSE